MKSCSAAGQLSTFRPRCSVPEGARRLSLAGLPVSPRLKATLRRCGVRRLGDLRGRSEADLRIACRGERAFEELGRLLDWAAASSARLAQAGAPDSKGVDILAHLDRLLSALSRHEIEVLSLRYGNSAHGLTLRKLRAESGICASVASGMILRAVVRLRHRGGAQLQGQLERIAHTCLKAGLPLTCDIVRAWMGHRRGRFHYGPAFYMRLIAELSHGQVPVCPVGPHGGEHLRSGSPCSTR